MELEGVQPCSQSQGSILKSQTTAPVASKSIITSNSSHQPQAQAPIVKSIPATQAVQKPSQLKSQATVPVAPKATITSNRFHKPQSQVPIVKSKISVPATQAVQNPPDNSHILREVLLGGIKLEMIKISAGFFLMGSDTNDREKPIHKVVLQEFYMGKYPVTQEQWQAVMGNNPSNFRQNLQNSVEQISWNDCQAFCKKLSQITGKIYRLPSEAEWEYVCRAGTQTRYYFGDNENQVGDYAWYDKNSGRTTHPVGQKKPNPWGLYDMYGNVWEWCEDSWHDNYGGAPTDGSPWIDNHSQRKVVRGGSWLYGPSDCRSAARGHVPPDYQYSNHGFRVVCVF